MNIIHTCIHIYIYIYITLLILIVMTVLFDCNLNKQRTCSIGPIANRYFIKDPTTFRKTQDYSVS